MPLKPGKEPLHDPATLISSRHSSILRRILSAIHSMWRNHLDSFFAQLPIQFIAIMRFVADQLFGLRLDHVEIEGQLNQSQLMMIGGVSADSQRKSMPVNDSHDLHALATLRFPHVGPTALGGRERRVDKAFGLIYPSVFPQIIGQCAQQFAKHLLSAPLLKAPMHGFVIGITLRQHMPLSAGVQDPQDGLQHVSCGHRFSARSIIRNVLFLEVIPDPIPLIISELHNRRQPKQHPESRSFFKK